MGQFLTLEEVEHHVGWMPREAKQRLALGPYEAEEGEAPTGCRVCEALKPVALQQDRFGMHAMELLAWHEVDSTLGEYVDRAYPNGSPWDTSLDRVLARLDARALRVILELNGACSYARCCVIYMLARHDMTKGA